MKDAEETMAMLEFYDLTRSCRAAGELAGCSPNTVAEAVQRRAEGFVTGETPARERMIAPFMPKIEEWVDRSKGRVRGDVVYDKLVAMGFDGSERTTRREVAFVKENYRAGHRRVFRPWVPEPGQWFQWDYGDGPSVRGVATVLFCAWLAWCRFRVVFPLRDKKLANVIGGIDRGLRAFGGCPTYALTDNERTVTTDHVARIPIRHPEIVAVSAYYGLTVATCMPADPPSKGGSEATVRIAKADLVPTDANLLGAYGSFAELEEACAAFCVTVNGRPHAVTRRPPIELLAVEREHLHRLPEAPYMLAFGQSRKVGDPMPMVRHDWCQYSAPHTLAGEEVWVREVGDDEIVIVHVGVDGPVEVARHRRTTPGNPRVDPDHFPPEPEGALNRTAVAQNSAEAAFLAVGTGAELWLREAAAAGVSRVRAKMADAVILAALHGVETVSWALGHAAVHGRFGDGDIASIITHRACATPGPERRAADTHSLQPGTSDWDSFGR